MICNMQLYDSAHPCLGWVHRCTVTATRTANNWWVVHEGQHHCHCGHEWIGYKELVGP
jgi:hypothetical protein